MLRTCALGCILVLLFSVAFLPAQTFTTLVNFDGSNGVHPYAPVSQGPDGAFYGTTRGGGKINDGTIFKITPEGVLSTLYSFCTQPDCSDGSFPLTGLVLGDGKTFYGTASVTIFAVSLEGVLKPLHILCSQPGCTDGDGNSSPLFHATDGNFYGTTGGGGAYGYGTIFKISPTGSFTLLHSFSDFDGSGPTGSLIQAADGNFYGTTHEGGRSDRGTIFRMTPTGALSTLYSFCSRPKCIDGLNPKAGLVESIDGALYGTTTAGGLNQTCFSGCGTIYRITRSGRLTTLHSFDYDDGAYPFSSLIQATDGNLYGTTNQGGPGNFGTIFKLDSSRVLTTLHYFVVTEGCCPDSGLLQATSGKFYGTTELGGPHDGGSVYSLDMGLGPFVAFVRDSGKVGGTGGILGQGFTGTTSVSLNGTPANFTVISDTFLKATVPAGATTGFVTVTTPSGTLTSNKPFRVTPQLLSFDPPSGPVGTQVTITGVSLTQTQGIGFGDRVPAQFTVISDTQVTAIVPAGAKTGKIGIETKGGQAISAGTFTVTP
jgi:uncharacterized repeat protein (TIGR03803 family)